MRRIGVAAGAVVAMLTVTGCTTEAGDAVDAWNRWDDTGVRDYSFQLRSGCLDDESTGKYGVPRGRFAVEVEDRQVVSVAGLDAAGRLAVADGRDEDVPSMSQLFEMLQDATADGADVITTEYGDDGHPTRMVIDDMRYQTGDANCFRVSTYRPG